MAVNMCVSLTLNGSRFSPLISTLFRILSYRDDVSERCHADTASAIFVRNPQARKTFPHRDWQRRSWRCKLRCSWIWRYYFRWYLYKYYHHDIIKHLTINNGIITNAKDFVINTNFSFRHCFKWGFDKEQEPDTMCRCLSSSSRPTPMPTQTKSRVLLCVLFL